VDESPMWLLITKLEKEKEPVIHGVEKLFFIKPLI
jgi:hypothetical protein